MFPFNKNCHGCGSYLSVYFIPYFLLNLSTRPSACVNLCLPVKNGWQFEHVSTRISFFVDDVSNSTPQLTHVTVILLTVGWIPLFINNLLPPRATS